MQQWKEFEDAHDHCTSWVKETELKVKEIDLKSSLKEKKEQLEKLRVCFKPRKQ